MRLLFIFLISTFSGAALSQEVRFATFADPQIVWFKPDVRITESDGIRAGLNVGFEMDYFFSTNYAFTTGLSLNNIGGKLTFSEPLVIKLIDSHETIEPGRTLIYRLQYLTVPLGLKFTTREIGYTTVYAKMGLSGHFNIRSNADVPFLGINNERVRDEVEFLNFAYHFGAGIQYSLGGQTALLTGLEFNHRFMDVTTNRQFKALLNSLSLRVGILF